MTEWETCFKDNKQEISDSIEYYDRNDFTKDKNNSYIDIDLPDIAENGNTVPIHITLIKDNIEYLYIVSENFYGKPKLILILKINDKLTLSSFTTRIRLTSMGDVTAIYKTVKDENGDFQYGRITKNVKVTIGAGAGAF
jgi:predicted secreted protein